MAADYDSYDYLAYWHNRSYEDKSERLAIEAFFKKISAKKTLLDVGGGFGRLASLYSPVFQKAVVFDPSEKNLAQGKNLFKTASNLSFIKGSLPDLPFKNKEFQTILMVRVSHHLENLAPSLKEINRVLADQGWFIFEFANKNHFWALIRAFLSLNFNYATKLSPVEKRSLQSIEQNKITFVNHHPKKVLQNLENSGFEVREKLSVSNFRNPIVKKIIPEKILLVFEKLVQKPFSKIFFGPSIFLLCQKKNEV